MAGYTREAAIAVDGIEAVTQWEQRNYEVAVESYKDVDFEVEARYCPQCGQLMRYRSLAYEEGYHFDSCY